MPHFFHFSYFEFAIQFTAKSLGILSKRKVKESIVWKNFILSDGNFTEDED